MPKSQSADDPSPAQPFSVPRRFRFSLFWLMATVTIVAVLLGLGSSLGSFFSEVLYLAICCIVPTPFVICVVFGRGYVRAFAIGALMPWIVLLPLGSRSVSLFIVALALVLSATCGMIAAVTWRWIRRLDEH
jgi:hypothetical protein